MTIRGSARIGVGGKPKPLPPHYLEIERRLAAGATMVDIGRSMGMTSSAVARAKERIQDVRSLEMVQAK